MISMGWCTISSIMRVMFEVDGTLTGEYEHGEGRGYGKRFY